MTDKFKKVWMLLPFISIVAGCAVKAYVQDNKILGDKMATLVIDPKLLEKDYGLQRVALYQTEVTCNGPGKAKVEMSDLGNLYYGPRDIRLHKVLIPAQKKLMVYAYYTNVTFFVTEQCEVSLEFQPVHGKEYFYSTKRKREPGFIMHGGDCYAGLYEISENEELTPLEGVQLVPYSAMFGRWASYCDDNGNVITQKEWEKLKSSQGKPRKRK
jgi:hypothetical protein